VQSTLRLARSMALANKKQYGVVVDPDNRTITVFRDSLNLTSFTFDSPEDSVIRVDTLPNEITSVSIDFDNDVITFAPNGTAGFTGGGSGGANVDIVGVISGHTVGYNLEIKRATGRVKMTVAEPSVVDG